MIIIDFQKVVITILQMGKLKVITKEVNLKEFRRRGCSVCGGQLFVDSYNGRTQGRYGHAQGKILVCKPCDLEYFYNWDRVKEKYVIERVFVKIGEVDAFIDYNGDLRTKFDMTHGDKKFNVLLKFYSHIGTTESYMYFLRTYSMPKKKIIKIIRDKAEVYAVFS
jgi:hypothetical protein